MKSLCICGRPQVVKYKGQKGRKKRGSGERGGGEAVGEERPSEVHGGGGECSTANAEEESDNDTQDVLGVVTEGAEVVGSEGLLGFPVSQRHVVAVDQVTACPGFYFDLWLWF